MNDYPELRLHKHNAEAQDYLSIYSIGGRAWLSITNLESLDKLKAGVEDKAVLRDHHEKLHALIEVQC